MTVAAVAAAALLTGVASAAASAPDPSLRTPGAPAYRLTLRSDAAAVHWRGHETVTFVNTGPTPIGDVWLRLWDNFAHGCTAPAERIANVRGGTTSPPSVDCTAVDVHLPSPLASGAHASLGFDLAIDVPRRNDRFGRIGRQVLIGNAIPVLAISDEHGPHLDPYVRIGESFYSQVGRFDATLDTPSSVALATTGVMTSSRPALAGRLVREYSAERVRDFAWAAGPMRSLERQAVGGVHIRVWYLPSTTSTADARSSLSVAVRAFDRYTRWFGTYPYPELDVVLARFAAFGGMEYPNIVFTLPIPIAVAHETAHQWWYGMVGDDEYHEPWLDEAFAAWTEETFDQRLGKVCTPLPAWPATDAEVTNDMAYFVANPTYYAATVYTHGSCDLQAIAVRLGEGHFMAILRAYFAAHAFGFSTTTDFKAAVQAATPGTDLTSLWADLRIQ